MRAASGFDGCWPAAPASRRSAPAAVAWPPRPARMQPSACRRRPNSVRPARWSPRPALRSSSKPSAPVAPHPRQDHADRPSPEGARHGFEHDIDRGAMTIDLRTVAEAAASLAGPREFKVEIAGREVDLPYRHRCSVRRFADRCRAEAVQPCGEAAGEGRRHVLADHRRRTVRWKLRQNSDESLHPAGRGADGDDPAVRHEGCVRSALHLVLARSGAARLRSRLHLFGQHVEIVRRSGARLGDAIEGADLQSPQTCVGAALRQRGYHDSPASGGDA